MRALVLSGGGSRGAYQAGAWSAYAEAGITFDLVVGTSVGAINGAQIVSGSTPEEMRHWWTSLRQKDLLRTRKDLWRAKRWPAFYDPAPMRRLLEHAFDRDRLLQSDMDLRVTAVDIQAGCEVVWHKDAITVDHLMAATALMPGLPPVEVEGRWYADGGHWNAFPVQHAITAGARDITAFLHDPLHPHPGPVPGDLRSAMRRTGDLVWHGRQNATLEVLDLRRRLPRRDPDHLRDLHLDILAPEPPFDTDILRFDPDEAARSYARGAEDARRHLAAQDD